MRVRVPVLLKSAQGLQRQVQLHSGNRLQIPLEAFSDGVLGLPLNFLSLAKVDPSPQQVIRSHSLKATLLSWSAKRGLPSNLRRLLGQHRKAKDMSVASYARDELAPTWRALGKLLRE
eukprot:348120-Amphidinium_carterae.1